MMMNELKQVEAKLDKVLAMITDASTELAVRVKAIEQWIESQEKRKEGTKK